MNSIASVAVAALLLSINAASGAQTSSGSGPNSVYIEQVGDSNTITIEQVGGNNNIGGTNGTAWSMPSSSNYGTITGTSNVVSMTQTGSGNTGQYTMYGNNNFYTSIVTGAGNKTKLTIGDIGTPSNLRNHVTETITGDTNIVMTNVKGNDINSTLVSTGDSNQVTSDLLSSSGRSDINISGNNNLMKVQQTDSAGSGGHVLTATVTGDYNSIVSQQQGFNDTNVYINTIGSYNMVTVRTSSGTIVGPLSATPR